MEFSKKEVSDPYHLPLFIQLNVLGFSHLWPKAKNAFLLLLVTPGM